MSNPILVPLDGSELAEEALPIATELAIRWREPLHLILVHQSPSIFLAPEAGPASLLGLDEEVRRNLKAYVDRTAARVAEASGVTVVPILLDGQVVPVIAHYATTQVARLVVMTTHGRGGVSRMFLGSVADRLIRHLRCPVILATPGAARPKPHAVGERRRAVIPLDGSRLAESIIDKVLAVYSPREVELELLSVVPIPALGGAPLVPAAWRPGAVEEGVAAASEYLSSVAARLRELDVVAHTGVLVDEQVARAAVRYADERHADLVAIATRGVAGIERAVIGSVADKVVRSAGIPVLVWNPLPGAVSHVLGDGFIAEAEPVAVQPGSARRHKGVR
jgi:nucleotide-binding universal stress UspA family protein